MVASLRNPKKLDITIYLNAISSLFLMKNKEDEKIINPVLTEELSWCYVKPFALNTPSVKKGS